MGQGKEDPLIAFKYIFQNSCSLCLTYFNKTRKNVKQVNNIGTRERKKNHAVFRRDKKQKES